MKITNETAIQHFFAWYAVEHGLYRYSGKYINTKSVALSGDGGSLDVLIKHDKGYYVTVKIPLEDLRKKKIFFSKTVMDIFAKEAEYRKQLGRDKYRLKKMQHDRQACIVSVGF